jgi:hypothetical protein
MTPQPAGLPRPEDLVDSAEPEAPARHGPAPEPRASSPVSPPTGDTLALGGEGRDCAQFGKDDSLKGLPISGNVAGPVIRGRDRW